MVEHAAATAPQITRRRESIRDIRMGLRRNHTVGPRRSCDGDPARRRNIFSRAEKSAWEERKGVAARAYVRRKETTSERDVEGGAHPGQASYNFDVLTELASRRTAIIAAAVMAAGVVAAPAQIP